MQFLSCNSLGTTTPSTTTSAQDYRAQLNKIVELGTHIPPRVLLQRGCRAQRFAGKKYKVKTSFPTVNEDTNAPPCTQPGTPNHLSVRRQQHLPLCGNRFLSKCTPLHPTRHTAPPFRAQAATFHLRGEQIAIKMHPPAPNQAHRGTFPCPGGNISHMQQQITSADDAPECLSSTAGR